MSSVTTCPRCGAAVPPGASLCPSCAAPVGAAAGLGVPSGHTTEPVLLPGTVPAPGHPGPAARVPHPAGFAAQTLPGFPTPPPAPAGPVGATEGKRVLAWLIDWIVIAVPGGIVTALMLPGIMDDGTPVGDGTVSVAPSALFPLYALVYGLFLVGGLVMVSFEGATGRTLGKLALGLRTQDVATGKPIGVGRGIVRGLVFGVSILACGIGLFVMLLSPLFDKSPRRQGWFDKAARAVVVQVARPRAPQASFVPGAKPGLAPVPGPAAQAGPAAYPAPAYPGAPFAGAPVAPAAPAPAAPPAPTAPPVAPAPGPAGAGWAPPAAPSPAAPGPAGRPAASAPNGLVTGVPGAPAAGSSAPTAATWAGGQSPQAAAPQAPGPQAPAPQAPAAQGAPAGAGSGFSLTLPDGSTVLVAGPALLGRDPVVPPSTTSPAPVLVAVPDRSVSKTHAELGVDSSGLWLVDRGSTNGTSVEAPGVAAVRAAPGQQVRVPAGSVVRLGDAVIAVGGHGGDDGFDESTVISARRPPSGGGSW